MTSKKSICGKGNHCPEITVRPQEVILGGLNLCQRRNESVKRITSNSFKIVPSALVAVWNDLAATCAYNAGKSFTESISTIPITLSGNYLADSAVLAPGGFIYMIPYWHSSILKVDAKSDAVTQFGSLGSNFAEYCGALEANGYFYCVPACWDNVLKIDPKEDAFTTIASLATTTNAKCFGAIAAANGCVYGIPGYAEREMKFDVKTDSVSLIGPPFSRATYGNWQGCVLASNGSIYGMPYGYNSCLKIAPDDDIVTTFGSYSGTVSRLCCGALFPNGCIYGIPNGNNSFLRVNSLDDAAAGICSPSGFAHAMASNGSICAFPNALGSDSVLKIANNITNGLHFKEPTLLTPYLNKY